MASEIGRSPGQWPHYGGRIQARPNTAPSDRVVLIGGNQFLQLSSHPTPAREPPTDFFIYSGSSR